MVKVCDIVNDIVERNDYRSFKEVYNLKFCLYKNNSLKQIHHVSDFRETIGVYEEEEPIAYSDSKEELEIYAKELNLKNYEVKESHCYGKSSCL